MQIKSTTNYDQFKVIKGNRNINKRHLTTLTLSIVKENLLEFNPIIVNEKMEVIDGQHRLEVAKANKLPIFYMVNPTADIHTVVRQNSVSKQWNLQDYINSFVTLGKENYIYLQEFMDNYELPPYIALRLFFGSRSNTTQWTSNRVKSGGLIIPAEMRKRGEKGAAFYYEIRPYLVRRGAMPRAITEAIFNLLEEGIADDVLNAIKEKGTPFVQKVSRRDLLDQFHSFIKK